MAAEPLVRVSALSKRYATQAGEDIHALEDVSIDLVDGEFVAVLGPSGCGKTTLLKILAGIELHDHGEVLFKGKPFNGAQTGTGVVFQTPVLLPWLTVLQNVVLPIRVLGLSLPQGTARARELLELVGLKGFENKYPVELSGGMQQRAAIVRGLIHDPRILLMDEPFGALDALTRERMNVELQRIWLVNKKTVFFITHSVSEAAFLADRVIVMSPRPGTIVDEVKVPFARPRDIDLTSSADFGRLTTHLRHKLGSHESAHD
ncbi:MAG: ABC transporter ATP-binding protein [Betaproteobacteria bacterium]|nr:MAG: ABC transporter ATP-binding protein [Betaproteobacteria bacterium]